MTKQFKRKWRELSPEHKERISQASGLHQPKSAEHRERISRSMIAYWENVPHKPDGQDDHVSMEEYLNGSGSK